MSDRAYGGLTEFDVLAIFDAFDTNYDGMITHLREEGCTSSEIFEILTKFRNGEL